MLMPPSLASAKQVVTATAVIALMAGGIVGRYAFPARPFVPDHPSGMSVVLPSGRHLSFAGRVARNVAAVLDSLPTYASGWRSCPPLGTGYVVTFTYPSLAPYPVRLSCQLWIAPGMTPRVATTESYHKLPSALQPR